MLRTKERLGELEAKVDRLYERVDRIVENIDELDNSVNGGAFIANVGLAMRRVLDEDQTVEIKRYIDGKEVDIKVLKNVWKELEKKRYNAEVALEQINQVMDEIKEYSDD